MSISEKQKEIRRRRKRRKNYSAIKAKLAKSPDAATKEKFAAKLRRMTPGADDLIKNLGLE